MPSGTPAPVSHISDTARWVATYRAMESERSDALFRDPYARKLAGTRGEEIVQSMKRGRQLAWPMIVRTAVMDELILQAVNRDGVDAVLNLAAGLDTRAYRLPLPRALRWTDVDLPDMLSYKEAQLAGEQPSCTLELAKVDLTDADARQALFGRVAGAVTQALVVTEGLLVYLTPEQVADLVRDLHAQSPFRWWLIDLASPRLLKMLQRTWGKQLSAGNSPMIFAPAEGTAFFESLGWREAEFRSTLPESVRLNRTMRFGHFWHWLSHFYPKRMQEAMRRMSGFVLLERTQS